jgi:hypothetical protein
VQLEVGIEAYDSYGSGHHNSGSWITSFLIVATLDAAFVRRNARSTASGGKTRMANDDRTKITATAVRFRPPDRNLRLPPLSGCRIMEESKRMPSQPK